MQSPNTSSSQLSQSSKTDDWCINLQQVSKTYKRKIKALDGISLQVAPGEVFGLLGPNGAGKSTLVKIMMTIVRANKANGTILGHNIGHKGTLANIGYLPEDHRFPPYLTGRQVLEYYAALARVNRRVRKKRASELLDIVGMSEWSSTPVKQYSKGMMQRVGLAQSLMNNPALVLLDEPTDGVDPMGRKDIREVLIRIRDEGRAVFINSHLLSEVEMICSRVAILNKGKVIKQGTIKDLTRDSVRYEIEYTGQPLQWDDNDKDRDKYQDLTAQVKTNGTTILKLLTSDPQQVQPVIDKVRTEGYTIIRVEHKTDTLEELFIKSVQHQQQLSLQNNIPQRSKN